MATFAAKPMSPPMVNAYSWRGYDGLVNVGFDHHFWFQHSKDEFIVGASHTNGIEFFWGFAKACPQQFKGLPKHTFSLHLKKSHFALNIATKTFINFSLNHFVNNSSDRA